MQHHAVEPIPQAPDKPPASCVGWLDAVLGLAIMFGLFFGLRYSSLLSDAQLSALMVGALGLGIGCIEIFRAPWRKTKPPTQNFRDFLGRAAIKYTGFLAGLAFIGFFYWVFPEYRRPFYDRYFEMLFTVLPFVPPIFAAYFLYAEWRFQPEKDGSWHAGLFALGRWKQLDWRKLQHNILCWMVKGYFLAIMFGDLANAMPQFRLKNWNLLELNFVPAFSLLFVSIVSFELVFVCAGYLFACRLFNSHIRTVEKTLFGWFIALISYGPFLSLSYRAYFGYSGGDTSWINWLQGNETLIVAWGSVILALLAIHMWCDACFGVRFSNLTNRGIITNGPYRFCKHPAYVIKYLRWWMVSVPFTAIAGWNEGLRYSLLLVGVGVIYAARAYTEERLLSSDPAYVDYALWMDKHSWLSWMGRIFPFMRYKNRLRYWRTRGELQPITEPVTTV